MIPDNSSRHSSHWLDENLTPASGMGTRSALTLDCHRCAFKNQHDQCGDCVMTHLLNLPVPAHGPALTVLIDQGLLPPSKFSQSASE
mgnify:FL=1